MKNGKRNTYPGNQHLVCRAIAQVFFQCLNSALQWLDSKKDRRLFT